MSDINKNQTFYIDFDGVILDTMPLYRQVMVKYNIKGDDSRLFRYMNVSDVINKKRAINNSLEILKKVQDKIDVRILSKVNNDYEARIKREFLESCGINIPFIAVPQYEKKTNYVKDIDKNTILIDDLQTNIDDWLSCGGTGLLLKDKDIKHYHCVKDLQTLLEAN